MRFDLKSGTDLAVHALFDPAAVLHVLNDPSIDPMAEGLVEEDAEQGNVLLYSCGSDGEVTLRVFVNEEPDAEVLALAAGRRRDLLLRVPSGKLFAAGSECLCRPDEKPIAAEEFPKVVEPLGQSARIPAGDYVVEAFEVRRPERYLGRLQRLFLQITCLGCLVSLLGTVVVLAIALVGLAFGADWGRLWLYWAAGVVAFWVVFIVAGRVLGASPSSRRFRRAAREFRARFPFDAVAVLRPLPDDADPSTLRGGCFGSAYAEA